MILVSGYIVLTGAFCWAHAPALHAASHDDHNLVPLDQRSENESSGSIRFEITIGNNRILLSGSLRSLRLHLWHAMAHA